MYYNSESSLTNNHFTWYEAHFRNGLRILVLDEDLSQAQFAQLEEFLDLDVDFVLFWAETVTSPLSLSIVIQM